MDLLGLRPGGRQLSPKSRVGYFKSQLLQGPHTFNEIFLSFDQPAWRDRIGQFQNHPPLFPPYPARGKKRYAQPIPVIPGD